MSLRETAGMLSLSDEELIEYALIGLRFRQAQIDRAIARIIQVTEKTAPLTAPAGAVRTHRPRSTRAPRRTGT